MEEEEVVLGLIPAPDWVENRPLEEGAEIELAVAKKLQHLKEAGQIVKIKQLKKENSIEEITFDSEEGEVQEVKVNPEEVFKRGDTPSHAGSKGAKIEKAEEKHRIATPIVFSPAHEGAKIEKAEEKHRIATPIVFSPAHEGGGMQMKQEEELQIESSTEFPDAEENGEVNMHAEEEPHIEAVTVFSDSDEDDSIHIKEEEELQIEAVTVYSDTDQSEEDSVLDQENTRYKLPISPFTISLAPQATVIETAVQDVYGCNSCHKSFSCTGELSRHVRCHPERRKPFICRVCLKTDSLTANLKRHMRTHSGEKPYSCVLCFKMFTSAYSLKIHMRIHSGYKPYSCKKCPRSFYQKTDLNKHNAVHLRAERILQHSSNLQGNSYILPKSSNSLVSPQLSVVPTNMYLKNNNSQTVNSQTKSPSNALRNSPTPFAPIITEVVGSFHEEDSEMQPCPSPLNNRKPQKQVAFHPSNSTCNQISMEKAVYSQPVTNSVNTQVINNTGTLQVSAIPVSSSGVGEFAVKKSVYKQPDVYSVRSQDEANLGTTLLSPVQRPTNVVQNSVNTTASAPNTAFVNNQPGGEIFCIPLILNGQICYAIPAPPGCQLLVNSHAPAQTAVPPINSHTVSTPETFLIPVFVPPVSNGVPSPNLSQATAAPVVTPQTSTLGNATPNQPQHKIGFQSSPVSTVTYVQPENSSGSQITVMNTAPGIQPENSSGSQMTNTVPHIQPENSTGSQASSVEPVPHRQLENSVGSQMTTVKTVPEVWSENSSESQITTMDTAPHSQPENSLGSRMITVSHGLPNKQFMSLPAPVTVGKPIQMAPYHDNHDQDNQHLHHHHNHDLTFTMKSTKGTMQHERVFCNTCKAPISVFTKRNK